MKFILPKFSFNIERWKFNKEYGVYVSNLGHFKDRQKRNLSIKVKENGYTIVATEKGYILSHRLVMLTFKPIPNREKMTVDHLDHNKRNNSVTNLEWVTKKENLKRARNDEFVPSRDYNMQKDIMFLVNGIKLSLGQISKLFVPAQSQKSFEQKIRIKYARDEEKEIKACGHTLIPVKE